MKTKEKELKKYFRAISGELYCPVKTKRRILATVKENVSAYLEENPATTFEEIQKHFGTPRQIAASYVEEMETPELIAKLRIRRRIITVICISVGIAILIWAVAVVIALIDSFQQSGGTVESFVTYVD